MSTWLEDYKRRLDGIIATKQTGVSATGSNDLTNAYALLAAANRSRNTPAAIRAQTARAKNSSHSGQNGFASALEKAYSTAFNAGKSGGSRLIDILSRPNYAVMNTIKATTQAGPNDEGFFEALWKGLSGKEKTTGIDVIRANNIGAAQRGGFSAGFFKHHKSTALAADSVTGLLGDIFLDPTTYIGTGAIAKVGKVAGLGKKATKTAEAVADVAKNEERAGVVQAKTASNLYESLQKDATVGRTLDSIPEQSRPFEPKLESTLTDSIRRQREIALVAAQGRQRAVEAAIGEVPVRRYDPKLQIKAPYNTKVSLPEPEPLAPTLRTSGKKVKGLSDEAALTEANYRYLLSDPKNQIPVPVKSKNGEPQLVSIEGLRKIAAENPEKAKMVDSFIRQYAKSMAKPDKDLFITLGGRTTSDGGKISHSDFIKLLRTGEVPKNKGGFFYGKLADNATLEEALTGGSKTDAFALHDAEDLNLFRVAGLTGDPEPVGDFLQRLGVKVQQVDPAKVDAPTEAVTNMGGPFDNPPDFSGKTPVGKTTFTSYTKKQKQAWIKAHKDILDPEDIQALMEPVVKGSKDAKYIDALVNKILTRKVSGLKSLDELMQAVKDGRVNPDDLKKLMTLTGAKTPEGIEKGLKDILKSVEDATKALKTEDDVLAESGKLWEASNPINTSTAIPVKPASEILHDLIVKGDDTPFVHVKDELDPKQVEDLGNLLKYAVDEEILSPTDLKKYGFETDIKKSKRTHAQYGKGRARNLGEWNLYSQLTTFNGLVSRRSKDIRSAIKAAGIKGVDARRARQAAMYDHVMPVMRAFDKVLVENGIPPTLGLDHSYTLSLADVLDHFPRSFVERHLFDLLTKDGKILHENIPPTVWNDAAGIVLDYSRGLISEGAARSALAGTFKTNHTIKYSRKILKLGTAARFKALAENSPERAEKYIDGIVDEFMSKAQSLSQTVENKAAELAANNIDGAKAVTEETMKAFAARVTDPDFVVTDIIAMANDMDAITDSVAKSLGVTSDAAQTIAKSDIAVKSAAVIPPEVMAEAMGANAMARVMAKKIDTKTIESWARTPEGKKAVTRVAVKQMENAAEAAAPFVDDLPVVSMNDMMKDVEATFTWRILHNFAPHLKNAAVRPIYLAAHSATQTNAKAFARKIGRVSAKYTKDVKDQAFKLVQQGGKSPTEEINDAAREIRQVVSTMFRDDKYDIFARTGITPGQVNQKAAHFGIPEKFMLEDKNSWKSWTFDEGEDPLDIMSKYQAAVHAAVMERQLGAKLTADFGSKTPKAGYVRIKNDNAILSHYLDPDVYFPREVAEQFSVLNQLLKDLNKPSSGAGWIKYYDSVLHSYKSGLTIYRPGHHFRNMIGDLWFSWMDGVNDPRVYSQAMDVMKDNWGQYTDWDALQAWAAAGETNAKTNKVVTFTRVGGKKKELTTGEIWGAARSRGLLTDYSTLEDIGTATERTMWKPHIPGKNKGKLHDAVAGISESRDHYIRLAHFIDRVQKSNGDSLEKIFDDAAARVRKWHPDGSDLTQFESKVMRRTILFYSWQRKAIPLVIESILHKPGKVLVYPKAMYAFAESQGIDPNSFGDPFPDDQLFPDWLREEVTGPQVEIDGNYWGINPGIPAVDILNDYGNSPTNTLMNVAGSAPMGFKQFAEVVTRDKDEGAVARDLRTGVPQFDLSDYLDNQIPSFGYISKVTGRSPSTLGIQARGQSLGATDQQALKAQEKNNAESKLTGLFNWLTGVSATNMSKPGTVKSAQFDQRQAIEKAMKDAAR